MPELPDVEVFGNYFKKKALKKPIRDIEIFTSKILKKASSQKIRKSLKGEQFLSVKRYGKMLFAALSNGQYLCLHFGMTGFLFFFTEDNPYQKHTRYQILFDHGILAYVDIRILGSLSLTDSIEKTLKEKKIGPDALTISLEALKEVFHRKGTIKTTLMDQSNIAGIGNVYCDEILFHAKIQPLRTNASLTDSELKRLHQSTKKVLKEAISAKADVEKMPNSWLLSVRKKGEKCPRCHHDLKRIALRGRGTFFCPHSQT